MIEPTAWIHPLPDWATLICPSCGNDRHFVVRVTSNTRHSVVVHRGAVYWGPEEREASWVAEIYCATCEIERIIRPVWPAAAGGCGPSRCGDVTP